MPIDFSDRGGWYVCTHEMWSLAVAIGMAVAIVWQLPMIISLIYVIFTRDNTLSHKKFPKKF